MNILLQNTHWTIWIILYLKFEYVYISLEQENEQECAHYYGPIGVRRQSKGHQNQHQHRLASSEMLKWRRPLLWPNRGITDREGEGKKKKC